MISSLPFEIPKRLSLSAQAAASIAKAIEAGTWEEFLPSERRLCELFQISRPTIRTALHLLAKEGRIEIHQGRRNRLLAATADTNRRQNRLVGLITQDRKSTRLNSSHSQISYAVFCLKKKKQKKKNKITNTYRIHHR